MNSEKALFFRNEFREARAAALEDAEGYQEILFVLDRLGAYLFGGGCCEKHKHNKSPGLGAYKDCIIILVKKHHPFKGNPPDDYHIMFDSLYDAVKNGRNDAFHQGAVARSLTSHSVELSLMLEDALMAIMGGEIKNYMTRNPVCAREWQPVSFVRQMMLENSFSYIPVYMAKKCARKTSWHAIADYHIAAYLRSADSDSHRKKLLAQPIKDAVGSNEMAIEKAFTACPDEEVRAVLERYVLEPCHGKPILVVKKQDNRDELLGIATAYDLM